MFARKKTENHGNAFEVTDDRRQHDHLQKDLVAPLRQVVSHVPVRHTASRRLVSRYNTIENNYNCSVIEIK